MQPLFSFFQIITLDDQDASNMKKAIIISDGDVSNILFFFSEISNSIKKYVLLPEIYNIILS